MADFLMTLAHQDEAIRDLNEALVSQQAVAAGVQTQEEKLEEGQVRDGLDIVRHGPTIEFVQVDGADLFSTECTASTCVSELTEDEEQNMAVSRPWSHQVWPLVLREAKAAFRDRGALFVRFGVLTFISILMGSIFYQVGDVSKNDYSMHTHLSGITNIAIQGMLLNVNPVLIKFPAERPVLLKESGSGLYSILPYVIAQTIIAIPLSYAAAAVQLLITYWLMGFNGNWFLMSFILCLHGSTAGSVGLVLGSLVADATKAVEMGPATLVPQILFAGFFISIEQIPHFLRWVQYICFLGYTLRLLVLAEFEWASEARNKLEKNFIKKIFG